MILESINIEGLILEGIVTTLNADGSVQISPMGPEIDAAFDRLVLKPFRTSTTYLNLKRTGQGVFHVTDNVEMLARAAVGALESQPSMLPLDGFEGRILADACRWYAFRVVSLDDAQERTRIECETIARGTLREFFGFNRAKHAVIEAAILATRVDRLLASEILPQLDWLGELVRKTGGPAERRAWDFLHELLHTACDAKSVP